MSTLFDLYGHGIQYLPSGDIYSNGPDRKRGPAKCRGVSPVCTGVKAPHDHACCCDPCRHSYATTCNSARCCRCVPIAMCGTFQPYSVTSKCKVQGYYAPAEHDDFTSYYTFATPTGAAIISVGEPTGSTSGCVWSFDFDAMGIHQSYPLTHTSGNHCQAPPNFGVSGIVFPFYYNSSWHYCTGDLSFTDLTQKMVPFIKKWENVEETSTSPCSGCPEICNILCVRRGTYGDDAYTRTEFIWDSGQTRYEATDNSNEYFSIYSSGGRCYFKFDDITPIVFENTLAQIESGYCSIGLNLTINEYEILDENSASGEWMKISCNKCSCWDYICGTCRCVCRDLCSVGAEGNDIVEESYSWSTEDLSWTSPSGTLSPEKTDNGDCRLRMTGFDTPYSTIRCGDEMWASYTRTLQQIQDSGIKYRYVSCKNCGVCGQGTCLDTCEDVPQVIYCDLEPSLWEPMLGCDDGDLCFEPVTFPLVLISTSPTEYAAGEYRWIGSTVISCKDCVDFPNLPPLFGSAYVVQADLSCDGIFTFSVDRTTATVRCEETFSMSIPCDNLSWTESFETSSACGDGLNGCCNRANFIGNLYL